MTPIALYPSIGSHKKAAALGAFNVFLGCLIYSWLPDGSQLVPAIFALAGGVMVAQAAWRYANPKPSFEADASGFSVMGKRKRSWDKYRGVKIRAVRVAMFPTAYWVIVQTGKSILGGSINIKFTHLSGPASEMAAEIDAYARHAQRAEALEQTLAVTPAAPIVNHVARPSNLRLAEPAPLKQPVAFAARLQASGSGPVQSTPRLSERLFGRRKVI